MAGEPGQRMQQDPWQTPAVAAEELAVPPATRHKVEKPQSGRAEQRQGPGTRAQQEGEVVRSAGLSRKG